MGLNFSQTTVTLPHTSSPIKAGIYAALHPATPGQRRQATVAELSRRRPRAGSAPCHQRRVRDNRCCQTRTAGAARAKPLRRVGRTASVRVESASFPWPPLQRTRKWWQRTAKCFSVTCSGPFTQGSRRGPTYPRRHHLSFLNLAWRPRQSQDPGERPILAEATLPGSSGLSGRVSTQKRQGNDPIRETMPSTIRWREAHSAWWSGSW